MPSTTTTRRAEEKRHEVIVIGSGAGGSTLCYQLARSGVSVLMIERGEFLRPQARKTSDTVGRYIHDIGGASCFVGGETKFYGSALYRMRESDFLAVEHENGISPAWPISYSDLEPYYERAERLYKVHGSTAGDASEPSHALPFPFPPIEHAPIVAELVRGLERSGTPVSRIPLGVDYGPEGKCVLCSTCDAYYCQLDAKMDAEVAALRPALATGNIALMTGATCTRVLTSADGTCVTGVIVLHRDGREQVIEAPVVAVCAGLRGTAALLRRSRTPKHPEGLGNTNGCLGRYLAGHSTGIVFPFTGIKPVPSVYTKTFAINRYYHGKPFWPYPLGTIQVAGQFPFWRQAPWFVRPLMHLIGKHTLTCFYMTEALPSRDTGFVFAGDDIVCNTPPIQNLGAFFKLRELTVELFRRAGYASIARRRPPHIWHEVGTARFGKDPTSSVSNRNCRVHDIEGLFVVDASVLPSAGAVNTALTIIALALRAGDHIAARQTLSTRDARAPATPLPVYGRSVCDSQGDGLKS